MNYLQGILSSINLNETNAVFDINGETTTYSSLFKEWQKLAAICQKNISQKGARVGILVSTKLMSLKCIGAMILVEKVYVPLDIEAPFSRNKSIIEQNQLQALLIETEYYSKINQNLPQHQSIPLEYITLLLFEVKHKIESPPNLAFILNTSGSTGTPKGVMVSHENVQNFIEWTSKTININKDDVIASIAPFHFDLSVFDIFTTLKRGTSLLLFEAAHSKNPRLIAQHLDLQKVSILYTTPTMLRVLLKHGKLERYDFSNLRYIIFAGEIFPIEDLKKLKKIWSQTEFYNWYGPTETNVCTFFKLPDNFEERQTPFPIGQACLPNTTKVSLDGELLVSGKGITLGYFNNEAKNQTAFSIDNDGIKWYHTGDLVRIDENGDYVFLGRKDRMVKRNAYRIELDEIEYWVELHPNIEDAGVVAKMDGRDNLIINCFYVTKKVEKQVDLRAYLVEKLPLYMLPNNFIPLEEIPQTSTQKKDYQNLIDYT